MRAEYATDRMIDLNSPHFLKRFNCYARQRYVASIDAQRLHSQIFCFLDNFKNFWILPIFSTELDFLSIEP